jgi:serine/threonine protein kinase
VIAGRPLKLDEALDIAIQTAQGLQAAHEKGVVHRDIKPANLIVNTHGQVKIMDFSLAQAGGERITHLSLRRRPHRRHVAPACRLGRDQRARLTASGIENSAAAAPRSCALRNRLPLLKLMVALGLASTGWV